MKGTERDWLPGAERRQPEAKSRSAQRQIIMEEPMTRIADRINRRTALVQLTAATMFAAGAAKAQRPDLSLAQINTTDLGHKTYMLEGQAATSSS